MSELTGLSWLLASTDPSVRYLALVDVLGSREEEPRVQEVRAAIPAGPKVQLLLSGQRKRGGFGVPSYAAWSGTHWRLVSLAHLAYPAGDPRVEAALRDEFRNVVADFFRTADEVIAGRRRLHGCVLGNALGAASVLGLASDPYVQEIAEALLDAQWPDGGWNGDTRPSASRSSFWETHEPMWGLWEYWRATGQQRARDAVFAAAELLLSRRLRRSPRAGRDDEPGSGPHTWRQLHYPIYWYYDLLRGLDVIRPTGLLTDPRADEALDCVLSQRNSDGTWSHTGSAYWALEGEKHAPEVARRLGYGAGMCIDMVDWGRHGPNEMITLIALRVLRAAGRL